MQHLDTQPMDSRQEAAFLELCENPNISTESLATMFGLTHGESAAVVDFYHCWREM